MPSRLDLLRSSLKNPLVLGLSVQALLVIVALMIGVLRPTPTPKETFEPSPLSNSKNQNRQKTAQRVKAYSALKPTQTADQRLMDSAMDLKLPTPSANPTMTFPAEALFDSANLFQNDMNALDNLDSTFDFKEMDSTIEFMGLKANAQRILFVIDVSASVKNKMETAGFKMTDLRKEVSASFEQLGVAQMVNIVQFSRRWSFFSDQFLPGTKAVKTQANEWLHKHFRTDGSSGRHWEKSDSGDGFLALLETLFDRFPETDLIILVGDGDFQSTRDGGGYHNISWTSITQLTDQFQARRPTPLQVRFLGFQIEQRNLLQINEWLKTLNGSIRLF